MQAADRDEADARLHAEQLLRRRADEAAAAAAARCAALERKLNGPPLPRDAASHEARLQVERGAGPL